MAIIYNEKKRTFSLHTAKTTYQLKIGNLNYVKHLYYGATIQDEDLYISSAGMTAVSREIPMNP